MCESIWRPCKPVSRLLAASQRRSANRDDEQDCGAHSSATGKQGVRGAASRRPWLDDRGTAERGAASQPVSSREGSSK